MDFPSILNDYSNSHNIVLQKNNLQKRMIIKHLFLNGSMTNTDLGKFVKLSTPKMISLLNELKEEEFIEELGQANSSGGRRPNLYGNKEDIFYIVGISIGLYKTSVCLFNAKNQKVIDDQTLSIQISKDISIVDPIVLFTQNILRNAKISNTKILGIGIEMPGLLDSKSRS